MAIGEDIVSVFSGPADISAFDNELYVPKETTHKMNIQQRAFAFARIVPTSTNSKRKTI